VLCYRRSTYSIPDSGISEYSTKNASNSSINKCYMTKKSDISDFSVNE